MADHVLYSFRRCPFAIRARLALAISAIRYELREVKLAEKPATMLAASPKGTVPVLVLADGSVIDESLDIMRWALAQNDPEGWLTRDDVALIVRADGPFKRDLDGYKYAVRPGADASACRERGAAFLADLEQCLSASRYLSGPARGLTDAAIVPFVRQFAAVDPAWFETLPLPRLQAWLADYTASSLFETVMQRVPVWEPGIPGEPIDLSALPLTRATA